MFANVLSLLALLAGLAFLALPTSTPELSRRHDRFLGIGFLLLLPILVSEPSPLVSGEGFTELCAAALVVGLAVEAGLARWQKLEAKQQEALRTRERWLQSRDDLLDAFARSWNRLHAFVVEGEDGTADPSGGPAVTDTALPAGAAADGAGGAATDQQTRSLLDGAVAVWAAVRPLFASRKPVGKLWKRPDEDGDSRDGGAGGDSGAGGNGSDSGDVGGDPGEREGTPTQDTVQAPQEPALPRDDGPPEPHQTGAAPVRTKPAEPDVKASLEAREPDVVTVEPEPVELEPEPVAPEPQPVVAVPLVSEPMAPESVASEPVAPNPAPNPEATDGPADGASTPAAAEPPTAAEQPQPPQPPAASDEPPDMVTVEPEPIEPQPETPVRLAPEPAVPAAEAVREPDAAPNPAEAPQDAAPPIAVAADFADVDALIRNAQPDAAARGDQHNGDAAP